MRFGLILLTAIPFPRAAESSTNSTASSVPPIADLHASIDNPSPSVLRAEAADAYRRGDIDRAIALYRHLASGDPRNPDVRRDLLRLLTAANRDAEAADVARDILALGHDDRETRNALARALHRSGQFREALDAYDTSLSRWPGQTDLLLARAQALESLRAWDAAATALADLRAQHPDFVKAIPSHARVLAALQRHADAARAWDDAARAFPDQVGYRFAAAESHFLAGETGTALAALRQLIADHPDHTRARNFLINHAIVTADLERALDLTRSAPSTADPVSRALAIARLQQRLQQTNAAIATLDALLAAPADAPANLGDILLMKADLLRDSHAAPAAAHALYARIAAANPANLHAWESIAELRERSGDRPGTCDARRTALALDPTDPRLLLALARAEHAAGATNAARDRLAAWIAANPEPPLPILLYHGLTPRPDDPLLASHVHLTTTAFDGQLRAFHDAGYTAVTMHDIRDWLDRRRELPPRAFAITFDDGRQDSFREATPILARYGFRATMFVAGVNADRNLPGYATWEELAAIRTNGIWELQSHGDRGSLRAAVAPTPATGLFLVNRLWLLDANRLEPDSDAQARIAAEFATGHDTLRAHLGEPPIAFAWPEGNFGQESIPNLAAAAALNLDLARRHYALAFHQDGAGLNVRTRAPHALTRYEPSPDASGADLLAHVAAHDPGFLIRLDLLHMAVRDGDAAAARTWLADLQRYPLAPLARHTTAMRVAYVGADYAAAANEAAAALALLDAQQPAANARALTEVLNTRARALIQLQRLDDALAAFARSLKLDPAQPSVWLAAANIAEAQRRYRAAALILERAHALAPDFAPAAPARGRIYALLGRHADAAAAWDAARAADPDRPDYRLAAAEAHFRAGHTATATSLLQGLLADPGPASPSVAAAPAVATAPSAAARDFLLRLALATNDTATALALLAAAPDTANSPDAQLRLADFYLRLDDPSNALHALDHALRLDPSDGNALLLKADVLRRLARPDEAALLYQEATAANRWCFRAWSGLAEAFTDARQPAGALNALRAARARDPSDPYLLLAEAQARYALGQSADSRRLLEDWLAANPQPALPVLLYHGLTTRPDDPLLASPVHHTTATFTDHLRALHDAGYRTVTAAQIRDWLAHKRELPPKSVWITFDDGRLDSFREATPVLRRFGFTAAMFVPGYNADRNLPGYANWSELARIRTNGVWELHAHGDWASSNVVINAAGRTALFLPNRQFRQSSPPASPAVNSAPSSPSSTRKSSIMDSLEPLPAWQARVAADYAAAATRLAERTGARPLAFAWPEGDFGQESLPNAPDAAPFNLAQVRTHFALAFNQDAYGFNPRTRDPALLTRREPDPRWSGADLLQHLADQSPAVLIAMQLLKQATWEGRTHDARRWLARLESLGASPARRQLASALVYSAAGESRTARALATAALAGQSRREAASLLETLERRDRPHATAGLRYWADSDDRRTLEARASHETAAAGPAQFAVTLLAAEHAADDWDTIREFTPSVGAEWVRELHHRFAADLRLHTYRDGPDAQLGGGAAWQAQWADPAATRLAFDRSPVSTVQALDDDVVANALRLAGEWTPASEWRWSLRGVATRYSDSNDRRTFTLELQRRLAPRSPLKAIAQGTLDDTSDDRDAYYTPRDLRLVRLGAQGDWTFSAGRRLRLRYLPGLADEADTGSRLVHAGDAEVVWPLRPGLDLRPSASFQRTPSYNSAGGALTLNHDF